MRKRKSKRHKSHKATHVSLISANDFHEDPRAEKYDCGFEDEDFGLKFICKDCGIRTGKLGW
jgi:hypothetical protein